MLVKPAFVPYSIVFTLCLDIIQMFILIMILSEGLCIIVFFLLVFICALPCKENVFFNLRSRILQMLH